MEFQGVGAGSDVMSPRGRRLGIGEIFDAARQVFQRRWAALTGITLLVDLPLSYAQGVILGPGDDINLRSAILANLVSLGGFISAAAVIRVTGDRLAGSPAAAWTEVLAGAVAIWPRLLGTALLIALLIVGGSLLLFVPGLILAVQASYALWTVVLRGESGMAAFRASRSLVRGAWWRTLGMLLALGLPSLTVMVLLSLPTLLLPDHPAVRAILAAPALLASTYYLVCVTILFRNVEALKSPTQP